MPLILLVIILKWGCLIKTVDCKNTYRQNLIHQINLLMRKNQIIFAMSHCFIALNGRVEQNKKSLLLFLIKENTYSSKFSISFLSVSAIPAPIWDNARFNIENMLSPVSFSRTTTLQRLSSALLTWKDGFSVVAPIRVIVPSSTCGSSMSCN